MKNDYVEEKYYKGYSGGHCMDAWLEFPVLNGIK